MSTLHPWDVSPGEAILIQKRLFREVTHDDGFRKIDYVAGVDIGYKKGEGRAAIVLFRYPQMDLVDGIVVEGEVNFPYITGLLSFREIPLLLNGFEKLKIDPDIILVDGQGIAHPRRLGLASHLGLLLDCPTVGCAKSRLWGKYSEPGKEKGSIEYIYDKDDVIGAAVRTRENVKVVFVSIGHKMSLDSSIRVVLKCCLKYRLPEPARLAHRAASGNLKLDRHHI
ncbi:MAG: deoxyribonuclease V [Candidatus Aminicenantes bacterium]|nr:deoxyribonuclease V [Candidatus Aminicenantes bacterium]